MKLLSGQIYEEREYRDEVITWHLEEHKSRTADFKLVNYERVSSPNTIHVTRGQMENWIKNNTLHLVKDIVHLPEDLFTL